jgi:hypothetical protein
MQDFEVEALRGVKAWLPPDARVTVPGEHHFDPNLHTVIMDDVGPRSAPLKVALLAGHISAPPAAALGTALGRFLRALHTWGRGTEAGGGGGGRLRVVEALAERRGAQIKDLLGETLVMGDFWPGNVLVGREEADGPTLVVDWEIARPGLAGGRRRPVLRRACDTAAPAPRTRQSGRRGTEDLCA